MHDYIYVSEEDRAQVRKFCGTDEESLKRDIGILKEWIKKQPHLPQDVQPDSFFENMLIRNKCRVEKTKDCIDAYYTYRSIWPDMYKNLKDAIPKETSVRCIPMKQLTENKERVIFMDLVSDNKKTYRFLDFIETVLALGEILLKHDYCTGVIVVLDYKYYLGEYIMKIVPDMILKGEKVFRHAYANRIIGMEFFNTASWLSVLLNILKPVMSEKLYGRIRVHDSIESVWKVCPKEVLPKEFGGTEELEKLLDEYNTFFLKNRYLLEETTTVKSNESLRIGKCKFYEADQFGLDGTFKKLNVD